MKSGSSVKIKLGSLVLLIFSGIYGFSNSLTAYYQMGYASIVWYIITALLFFLPSALIFAEYGAAFKGVRGGTESFLGLEVQLMKKRLLLELLFGLQPGLFGWFRQHNFS